MPVNMFMIPLLQRILFRRVLQIYIQRFQFDQSFRFSTYLYMIIKNKSMNYLKKNRELPLSSFDEEKEVPVLEQKLVSFDTPEKEYLQNCLDERLYGKSC